GRSGTLERVVWLRRCRLSGSFGAGVDHDRIERRHPGSGVVLPCSRLARLLPGRSGTLERVVWLRRCRLSGSFGAGVDHDRIERCHPGSGVVLLRSWPARLLPGRLGTLERVVWLWRRRLSGSFGAGVDHDRTERRYPGSGRGAALFSACSVAAGPFPQPATRSRGPSAATPGAGRGGLVLGLLGGRRAVPAARGGPPGSGVVG
ncbi:hypothetical protein ACPCUJ_24775, partial [Peterkaempfera bronchialis]